MRVHKEIFRMLAVATFLVAILVSSAATLAAPAIDVTVRVRTPGGGPVPDDAYVALVPVWRPSSKPLVEEIAKGGVSVLRVPPGNYRLIAGARGFVVSSSGPLSVSGTSGADLAIELPPLKPATGSVRDADGRPIPNARVAGKNATIAPPLGTLSELAFRHLASDWSATTDASGIWTLQLPEGNVPLLFEAPGHAAEWRIRTGNDAAPLDVSLSKGATLTLTTDRADQNLIVTLLREDTDEAENLLFEEQPRVWARWTKDDVITWSSLPPGVYGIYAKYPDPRYFMQTATKLATVTLSADGRHEEYVALPPVRRAATSSTALFLQGIFREDLGEGLRAFGRDIAGIPRRVDHFVEEVIGGSVVHLNSEGVRPPFHAMTEDRFFSTIPSLTEPSEAAGAEPWPSAVHARADASLALRFAEEGMQIPQSGVAVLRDCSNGETVIVPVEIRNESFARFTAAAGCRSLVLEFEPFEPIATNTLLGEGKQWLGEFILRGAGSADVRVARDPGRELVSGANVRIMVMSDERPEEPAIVVGEAATDDHGWVHVSGLPPHRNLQVIAETSDGSRSEAIVLRIEPRERGLIDPLLVPEPAALVVDARIDEAVVARFSSAIIVSLRIQPADPYRRSEELQESMPNTPTRFGPLYPGRWLVNCVVKIDDTYSFLEIDDVELSSGETRHIEVKVIPNVFEGVVTWEGAGVAARVIIEDRERTLYFNSDASGRFRAVLERIGTYAVFAARLSAQGNMIPIGRIAFTDPSRRVEIALPTRVSVTTRVRTDDRPVPRAVVWMSRRDESGLVESRTNRGQTTDSAGEATFSDVAPGVWTFSFRDAQNRRGAEKSIAIDGDHKNLTIDLDLDATAAIEGTVRNLGGSPLPRALVQCVFMGPTGLPGRANATSSSEGTFAIDLIAPPPPFALCSVTGPMGTVDAVRMIPGEHIDLTVPAATATLLIPDWAGRRSPDTFWLVAPDGRAISLNTVAVKIGQFGSPLTIPALTAGRWRVVRVESLPQWHALASGLGASLPYVAEIFLRAGMTETVLLR